MKYGPVVLVAGLTVIAAGIIYATLIWINLSAKLAEML